MHRIAVMIVNSRPFFRAGVRQVIAQGNSADLMDILECDPGENGHEAIAQIAAESPDILVLDIAYPFLDGLELCKKIVRTFPQIRVVILSTNPVEDDDELFQAIKNGAAAYIRSKHCSPAELIETILRASKGEYPINDSIITKPKVARRVMRQFQEMASSVRKEDDIVAPLTAREVQILTLVADGNANKRIAVILGVSEQTIKNHISATLRKLNASDRAHAVMLAVRNGWVPIQRDRSKSRRGDILSEASGPSRSYFN